MAFHVCGHKTAVTGGYVTVCLRTFKQDSTDDFLAGIFDLIIVFFFGPETPFIISGVFLKE